MHVTQCWPMHARRQMIILQHTALQRYPAIPTAASVPPHCTSLSRTNSHTPATPALLAQATMSSTCMNASCSLPNRHSDRRRKSKSISSIRPWRREMSMLRARRARPARQPGQPRRPWPRCSSPRPRRVRALGPPTLAPTRGACRHRVRTAPPQPQEPRPAGPHAHQGPPPAPVPFDATARLQRRPSAPAPHGLVRAPPQTRWVAAAARRAAGPLPKRWPTIHYAARVGRACRTLAHMPITVALRHCSPAPPPLEL